MIGRHLRGMVGSSFRTAARFDAAMVVAGLQSGVQEAALSEDRGRAAKILSGAMNPPAADVRRTLGRVARTMSRQRSEQIESWASEIMSRILSERPAIDLRRAARMAVEGAVELHREWVRLMEEAECRADSGNRDDAPSMGPGSQNR